jgi:tRNA(Glu) U13 pseudouridine synthase TruD
LSESRLEAERRALRLRVDGLEWAIARDVVELKFRLHRGAFATAVLREMIGNGWEQISEDE